jgi:histidyl-tRNA synthetase
MAITACRGTVDILPAETPRWRQVEEAAHRVADLFGYKELRTPAFEVSELFTTSLGEDSDIVEKELYTFRDRSGRSLTLRPELTVPVVRAYLEHNLGSQLQLKTYYVGEIWRYERPQSGRLREAHQFGVEALGSASPALDAEMVDLAMTYCAAVGLKDLRLEVNSVGCKKCRPAYAQVLKEFFLGKDDVLCQDCERRKERNPIRVLDCRKDACLAVTNTAPTIFQALCPDCRNHFFSFKEHLGQMGYAVNGNPRVVHSLGYYTRNVWQIVSTHLGPFNPVSTGGRYDELIGQLGSTGAPACGLAIGLERVLMAMEKEAVPPPEEADLDVFLVGTGEEAERLMTRAIHQLRSRGWRVERDYMGRGIKNQLKSSEKMSPRYTVLVGEEETRVSQVTVTDTARNSQENVSIARLVDSLDFKLRRDARERGRDKGRGRRGGEVAVRPREEAAERAEPRGRREEPAPRRERGEGRGRREAPPREEESGALFNEWAATYSEAARASGQRPLRRVPLAESALTHPHPSEPALQAWGHAQTGLSHAIDGAGGRWPAAPVPLSAAIPISIPELSASASGERSWLIEETEVLVEASFEEEGFDSEGAAGYEDDDSEDDGDALAAVGSGGEGEGDGERRRRGGRRGGRRHGRKRTRKS